MGKYVPLPKGKEDIFISMRKTIRLTESDLISLVNKVIKEQSTTFIPEMLNSPKAKSTKSWAQFFNRYYKLQLPMDGKWDNPQFNIAMKRYIEEKKLPVYFCKSGDDYCNTDGEVVTKDINGLYDARKNDESPQGGKVNTTNDTTYDYKFSNGKYYYSMKGQNKWIEAKGKGLESIKTKVKF